MTGISPNSILNRHPMFRNRMGYGDTNVAALSLDNKTVDAVKDRVDDNVAGKLVMNAVDDSKKKGKLEWLKEKAIVIGLGVATTFSLDKVFNFLVKGETHDKSLIGKLTNGIDKFSDRFKFFNFDWAKNIYRKTLGKSTLISSMADAPAEIPIIGQAKQMVAPVKNKAVKEFFDAVINAEASPEAMFKTIKMHMKGLNRDERQNLRTQYNEILKKSGKAEAGKNIYQTIIKGQNAHFLEGLENGNRDKAFLQEALDVAKKIPCNKTPHLGVLANEAELVLKVKSPISKLLVAGFNTAHRFLSYGGVLENLKGLKNIKLTGKKAALMALGGVGMHLFMGIMPFGDMAKSTIDAPKGEKKSTAAHMLLVEFVAGWMMMDAMAGLFYKGLGSLRNAKGGNWFTKSAAWVLRKAGDLASTGLHTEAAKSPIKGKVLSHITFPARKGFEWLKKGGGFVGRFAFVGFIVMPLASKIMTPICHKLFGEPKTLMAKDKAKESSGSEQPEQNKNNMEELKKALAENKAESKAGNMLTVAAKNQNNPAGTTLKLSDVPYAEMNMLSPDEIAPAAKNIGVSNPKYSYVPSEERMPRTASVIPKNQEDEQKQAQVELAANKTDRLLEKAKSLL